ncbi:MAG: substrate-binding domain-containing protein [Solirubrobacteraceae bacterium]|nr:substrate-binding domain-containing protein [Solirubrobacteraceae bacterium]
MGNRTGRAFALAACASLALGVAACGDDDNDEPASSGSSAATTTSASSTPELGSKITPIDAAAAGKAQAGEPTDAPKGKTLGYLTVVGGIDSTVRDRKALEAAAGVMGWKVVYCDGQGDTSKTVTCMNTLLARNVDAILTDGVASSQVAGPLREARKRDIPGIVFSGENPGWDAQYGPDEGRKGEVLAEYFKQRLGEIDGEVKIAVSAFPQPWASNRTAELEKLVKDEANDLKIVATTAPDPANLIEGGRKAAQDQLTQNPDIKAFWVDYDAVGQVVGQTVAAKFAGKSFPDRPLVATFHADAGTNKLIRSGAIDVVADAPYDAAAWVAVDQLAQLWARDEPLSQELAPSYGDEAGDLYTYQVITKDNVPEEGETATVKADAGEFFRAKWAAEFGTK